MNESKKEALDRLRKALQAHEDGLITQGDYLRIEREICDNPNVKPQNVKDVKQAFRDSLVKNARR